MYYSAVGANETTGASFHANICARVCVCDGKRDLATFVMLALQIIITTK